MTINICRPPSIVLPRGRFNCDHFSEFPRWSLTRASTVFCCVLLVRVLLVRDLLVRDLLVHVLLVLDLLVCVLLVCVLLFRVLLVRYLLVLVLLVHVLLVQSSPVLSSPVQSSLRNTVCRSLRSAEIERDVSLRTQAYFRLSFLSAENRIA